MLTKLRLLTPGPTPIPEEVRLALARDMVHHRKPGFKDLLARVQGRLRELFGTSQPVLPLSCSGTGAMTAAVDNLFAPGERVLVVEAGKFSERWTEISRHRGLDVDVLAVEWGRAVDPESVRQRLKAAAYAGVLVQLSETSTGVLHPVRELGAVTRGTDTLLVVDGISGVGVSPCPMDPWGVDCLVTGSQKGLMLPPGLALAALSERAWAKAEGVAPQSYYFDLKAERDNCLKNQTRFTSPVGLLAGLDVALELLLTAGLPAIYRKQWALTRMAREGLKSIGLQLMAQDHFTWGLTSVRLPAGPAGALHGPRLLADAAKHHGVVMAGGQGALKDRVLRVGHMGWVDYGDLAAGLYAVAAAAQAQGFVAAAPHYLERALAAYEAGLNETPPLP